MHILILILMIGLMAHDASGLALAAEPQGWQMLAIVLGTNAILAGCTAWACARTLRAMRRGEGEIHRLLRRLDVALATVRYAAVALFLGQLYGLGWLHWVRQSIGDWVLLDELIAAGPGLLTLICGWFFYYPIDQRLRGVAGPGTASAGTRLAYVVAQVRMQVLLVLAPLLAVMGWMQLVERWVSPNPAWRIYEQPLMLAGFTTVFLFAPVMIRYLWDTAPMPDGELRRSLLAMCRGHGVGVRRLLMWRTYGGMINGAVMGVIGPVRYILLTDGLLQRMSRVEIEAVMAHELGHVRRRHMVWLVVCAMAVMYGLESFLYGSLDALDRASSGRLFDGAPWQSPLSFAALGMLITGWVMIFGWISRRFERQADTFAVRHLSAKYPEPGSPTGCIDPAAVRIYCQTLMRVAELNQIPLDRRSWRHGSIRWRCDYLQSLVAQPADRCGVDRVVRAICLTCATVLLLLLVAYDGWLAF